MARTRSSPRVLVEGEVRTKGDRPRTIMGIRKTILDALSDEADSLGVSRNHLVEKILLGYCQDSGYLPSSATPDDDG